MDEKNDDDNFQEKNLFEDNEVSNILKQSFEFWHQNYVDSLINYSLVWKKSLDSNSEIIKKINKLTKESKNNSEILFYDFLDLWSHAIRQSNFELAKKSLLNSDEFWKNITNEQFKTYAEILKIMENYWENIQLKNIE